MLIILRNITTFLLENIMMIAISDIYIFMSTLHSRNVNIKCIKTINIKVLFVKCNFSGTFFAFMPLFIVEFHCRVIYLYVSKVWVHSPTSTNTVIISSSRCIGVVVALILIFHSTLSTTRWVWLQSLAAMKLLRWTLSLRVKRAAPRLQSVSTKHCWQRQAVTCHSRVMSLSSVVPFICRLVSVIELKQCVGLSLCFPKHVTYSDYLSDKIYMTAMTLTITADYL